MEREEFEQKENNVVCFDYTEVRVSENVENGVWTSQSVLKSNQDQVSDKEQIKT